MSQALRAWRIATDSPDYEADDTTGKGAELTGGRWNRRGVPVIYSSSSRALACLETVVHLAVGQLLPLNRYLVEIEIPGKLLRKKTQLDSADLVGWDAVPAGRTSIDWGASWLHSRETLVALVPSIVVPEEFNVLINPQHPDIKHVTFTKVRRWTYDPRLG